MSFRFVCTIVLFALACPAGANLVQRERAMELFNKGKSGEALALFLEMGNTRKDLPQAEALLMAARCAQQMGDSARALEIAGTIRLKPYAEFARLSILQGQKAWKELAAFPSGDIDRWPEKLIAPAHAMLGAAHSAEGNPAAAAEEYGAAARITLSEPDKARFLLLQAQAAEKAGQGGEEVLALYGQIVNLAPKGGGILQRARIGRVSWLVRLGREKAALEEVRELEAGSKDAYWIAAAQIAHGDIDAAFGRADQARAHYQAVCEIPSAPPELLSQAKAKLVDVTSASSRSNP